MLFKEETDLLAPAKTVKGVPLIAEHSVFKLMYREIDADLFFNRRGKTMTNDLQQANDKIDSYVENINKNMTRLLDKEKAFVDTSKRISSNIRKNSESMTSGIGRIKQAASFEELEKYTNVLERLVGALDALAIIEKQGKLDKIIASIK